MASLGSLVIELAANTARLQSDMGKAVNIVQSGARVMSNAFKGLVGVGIVTGFTEMISRSIELGDNLNKAAIKAGVGARAISELAYAAKLSDIDLNSLSTALKKMQVSLSQANSGGKEQIQTLAALGLTIRDLKQLSPDRQFEVLAEQINKLTDPADRARAAVELFGKSGVDLLPLFEKGAEGIRKAREEADKLGASFSGEQLKKLADADDAVKRLSASWDSFGVALAVNVARPLSYVLDLLHGELPKASLESQIANLNYQISFLEGTAAPRGIKKLQELKAQLIVAQEQLHPYEDFAGRKSRALSDGSAKPASGFAPSADDNEFTSFINITAKKSQVLHDYYTGLNDASKTSLEQELERLHKIEDATRVLALSGQISWTDAADRIKEANDGLLDYVQVTAQKLNGSLTMQFDKIALYAEDAAHEMKDGLENFLFDPFSHGLKGMASEFTDTVRRMTAKVAAEKIFDSFGGVSGVGHSLSGFFKGLLGFANGGSILPGGGGSTDSQVVAFRKSPSEQVDVYTPGGRGGGVTNHFHIDARGAQEGVATQIARALQAAVPGIVNLSRVAVRDDISRRAYG